LTGHLVKVSEHERLVVQIFPIVTIEIESISAAKCPAVT
jgi:hypothetical protein